MFLYACSIGVHACSIDVHACSIGVHACFCTRVLLVCMHVSVRVLRHWEGRASNEGGGRGGGVVFY